MAAGLSLIFGMLRVLNVAHGALFLMGGYLAFALSGSGLGWPVLVLAVLAGSLVFAAVLYCVTMPLLPRRDELSQALVTLGLAFILAEVARHIWGSDVKSVAAPGFLSGGVDIFGGTYPVYRLALIGVGICVALALDLVLRHTRAGALIRAAVADREMLSALGVATRPLFVSVFVAGTVLAVGAGALAAPVLGVYPGLDTSTLILTLIVVVIGGLGSVRGAMVGALLIGQVQTLGVILIPQFAALLLFAGMALVLIVRPTGLAGEALP